MTPVHNYTGKHGATFCRNCGTMICIGLTDNIFCDDCEELPYKEIYGDLITGALTGYFDVIAHACNCYSIMRGGITTAMNRVFKCHKFDLEARDLVGSPDKLGYISYEDVTIPVRHNDFTTIAVVNAYTYYKHGEQANDNFYLALARCLRRMNVVFESEHIGLPMIGCGTTGANWDEVKKIIQRELCDCRVTVVKYDKNIQNGKQFSR